MRALLFALVITSTTIASAGPCAIEPLAAHAMTVNGTVIPPGGGVLVALSGLISDWSQPSQDLTKTAWKFRDGGKDAAPTVTILAPGLAVYEPPAGTTDIKLDDAKRTLVTIKRTATATPALAAPTVKAITHLHTMGGGPRAAIRDAVIVRITSKRPASAVAMILFAGKSPASWVSAFNFDNPTSAVEIYHSPGRCETAIPGMVETKPGSRVAVAWVDAAGRVGVRSAELTVVSVKPIGP